MPRWLSAVELQVSSQLRTPAFRWRRMFLGARLSGLGCVRRAISWFRHAKLLILRARREEINQDGQKIHFVPMLELPECRPGNSILSCICAHAWPIRPHSPRRCLGHGQLLAPAVNYV